MNFNLMYNQTSQQGARSEIKYACIKSLMAPESPKNWYVTLVDVHELNINGLNLDLLKLMPYLTLVINYGSYLYFFSGFFFTAKIQLG